MSAPLPSPPSLPPWLERRPTKRAECPPPDQQCPWVSCRYHLAIDFRKRRDVNGKPSPPHITYNLPENPKDWPADAPTCALHVADAGEQTLDQVGAIMGDLSRERVRQIGSEALARLAEYGIVQDMAEALDIPTGDARYIDTSNDVAKLQRIAPAHTRRPPHREEYAMNYCGVSPMEMTAKMRKIQSESRAPVRTISPAAVDLADLEAQIAHRRVRQTPRQSLTHDTFAQQAELARTKGTTASAASARTVKAVTPTTPRPPSPPSTASLESPPQVLPATIQADDQPEVAVVSALPDPQPTPPSPPMTRPDPRTRRTAYADAHETAQRNLAKLMAERGLTRDKLSALARDAYTEHTAHSVDQGVVRALHGTASPVSVWYRRLASLLGVPLSDLCSDPMWLAAVAPEDSPVAAPHSHLHRPPAPPDTPPPSPQHSPESTLIPLLAEALRQAQAADRRTAELTALTGILRAEIDDLQQQLAACTKERDAATTTLARIKAAL